MLYHQKLGASLIIGDPQIFAIESEMSLAYESPSLRALGMFVIHVASKIYGVRARDASMLACSLSSVEKRISNRGQHIFQLLAQGDARKVAGAFSDALYMDMSGDKTYCGLTQEEFTDTAYSTGVVWAPDGDEAFDDGSMVVQFDVDDRVRLIAFHRDENGAVDAASVGDVWLKAELFYATLAEWRDKFLLAWSIHEKTFPSAGGIVD
jgi:Immunity protein 42